MKQENKKSEQGETDKKDLLYYFDKGLLVFTEVFHLRRGYCCKSGCRHCPWKEEKKIIQGKS